MLNKKFYSLLVSCALIPCAVLAGSPQDTQEGEGCTLRYSHAVTQDRVDEEKLGDLADQNPLAIGANLTEAQKEEGCRLAYSHQMVQDPIAQDSTAAFKKALLPNTNEQEEVNVLSLDGGGIRGIGTLCMLSVLEMKTGKKVHELFDRIYGTSTGGLAGALLAQGQSATQVLNLYCEAGGRIFNRGWWDTFSNPLGLRQAAFNPDGLEGLIREVVGDAKLSDVKIPVGVTAVNKTTNGMVLLSSEDEKTKDVTLLEAGRATSAAPTYFPAKAVKTKDGEFMAMDGGVIVNNPSMVAYDHTRDIYEKQGKNVKVNMFSFGTGSEAPFQLGDNAGKLGFGNPGNIPAFFMGLIAQKTEDDMKKLHDEGRIGYGRFQFNLPAKIDLADISSEARGVLMARAWERSHDADFTAFVRKLEANQLKKN